MADHEKNRVLVASPALDPLSLTDTARYPGSSGMRTGWYTRGNRDVHRKAVIAVPIKRTADCDRGPCSPFWIKNEAVSSEAGHSIRLPPAWPLNSLSFTSCTLPQVFRRFTASFIVCNRARGSRWLCSRPPPPGASTYTVSGFRRWSGRPALSLFFAELKRSSHAVKPSYPFHIKRPG